MTEEQIKVYGTTWCPDCIRAKRVLAENHTPYLWINIEDSPEAVAYVEKVNHGLRSVPTIVFPDGTVMVEPGNAELGKKLESLA
jgi:mycoredoxin